jgi:hypothetical protein
MNLVVCVCCIQRMGTRQFSLYTTRSPGTRRARKAEAFYLALCTPHSQLLVFRRVLGSVGRAKLRKPSAFSGPSRSGQGDGCVVDYYQIRSMPRNIHAD